HVQDTPGIAAEPRKRVERDEHLRRDRLDQRLSRLGNDRPGDLVAALERDPSGFTQKPGTSLDRLARPAPLREPPLRSRLRDALGLGRPDAADLLERRGIDNTELAADR